MDEAALEETMGISYETSWTKKVCLVVAEKGSPGARKGSIEESTKKRCRVWSRNFDAPMQTPRQTWSHVREICEEGSEVYSRGYR